MRINNTAVTQEGIAPFTVDKGSFGTDRLVSVETFHGTQGDDVIYVGGLEDSYTIDRDGNDRVIASQDPNAIDNHLFVAGAGNDTLIGTVQSDRVDYQDSDGFNGPFAIFRGVDVDLATGVAIDGWGNTDTLISIERVEGTRFDDVIRGNDASNDFDGFEGNDLFDGRGGDDDRVRYDEETGGAGVVVDLALGTATDSYGDTDTLISIERVTGSQLGDILRGDEGDNDLDGKEGNDTIEGGAGRDFIEGDSGDDSLSGGTERDTFVPGQGNDTVDGGESFAEFSGGDRVRYDREHEDGGTSGISVDLATGIATDTFGTTDTLISIEEVEGSIFDDTILGASGNERLRGEDGNDFLDAVGGLNNDLSGGAGNDTLIGSEEGGDFFQPGTGIDSIEGGDESGIFGTDELSYFFDSRDTGTAQGIQVTLTAAGTGTVVDYGGDTDRFTGIEQFRGTNNADIFTGSSGSQEYKGMGGDDTIIAGSGDEDRLDYNSGNDDPGQVQGVTVNLDSGTATDRYGDTDIFSGIEEVDGSRFGDVITGNAERNELRGRNGDDLLDSFGGERNFLGGEQGNDTINARGDRDFVSGGDGNDLITFFGEGGGVNPGLGSDTITAGTEGFFDLNYGGVGINVTIDVAAGTTTFEGSTDVDVFTNIVNVEGGDGNDTLLGNDGERQEFISSLGDDFIDGRGDGDDGDRDWLIYSVDEDDFTAEEAAMVVNFTAGTATGTLAGTDTFVNIEAVRGSHGNDLFIGSDQLYEEFQGLDGVDTIEGGGGLDRITYSFDDNRGATQGVTVDLQAQTAIDGFGNADVISGIEQVNGSAFADTLLGSDEDNVLIDGGGGNDTMDGRGGDDFFWMGDDAVRATGGAGADEFGGFINFFNGDTITDFTAEDRINIFDAEFNELAADATIVGNELRLDIDGDGAADGTIILDNGYTGPVNVVGGPLGGAVPTVFSIQDAGQYSSVYLENDGPDTITITRSGDLTSTASVDITVAGFGPNPADQFDVTTFGFGTPITLTFAPGVTERQFNVGSVGDFLNEADEDLSLTLSNAVSDGAGGVQIDGAQTFHRILNDDAPGGVRIDGERRNEDAGEIEFTVTREGGDQSAALEVPYLITSAGGLQGAEADDVVGGLPQSGTVTIPAGASQAILLVEVTPDTVAELHDDIVATISRGAAWPTDLGITLSQATSSIRNDDGIPPVLPTGATGSNFGDPHLVTLDGLAYSFQAVGEFTLIEAQSGDPLQVQVRFQPVQGSQVASQTTAVATELGAARVVIDIAASSLVTVDGLGFDLASAVGGTGLGDGDIYYDGEAITLVYANGEQLRVDVFDGFLSTSVSVAAGRDLAGLLGNGDGDSANDLALRDGTILAQPVSFADLYGSFADAWRISDATSLFDYTAGQGTADFTDLTFPAAGLSVEDFPAEVVALAEIAAGGIDDPVLREAAILDYLVSGNEAFVEAAAIVDDQQDEAVTETAPTGAPEITAGVGVSVRQTELTEGDSGAQTVDFTIYRTGDLSDDLVLELSVGGTVDASDYAGPADGPLVLAAGERSQTVSLDILGDAEVEETETLELRFTASGADAPVVLSSQAAVTILNDDLAPLVEPEPELNLVEGSARSDQLRGTDGDDLIVSLGGGYDRLWGNAGADLFVFGAESQNGRRERDAIYDYETGIDEIVLTDGASIGSIRDTRAGVTIFLEGDRDAIYLRGRDLDAEDITITIDDALVF